jgi:hypothetical protein
MGVGKCSAFYCATQAIEQQLSQGRATITRKLLGTLEQRIRNVERGAHMQKHILRYVYVQTEGERNGIQVS